jgi:hypothetical protein
MAKNTIGAIAVLLCTLVLDAVIVREQCRLSNVHWQVCTWMSIPHGGGPFSPPPN